MPAVRCRRNPRAFPPRSTRQSTGPADKDRASLKALLKKHISLFARYVSIMQKGKYYCENNELVECWLSSDTRFVRLWRLISYESSYRTYYEQNSNYLA